jgi:capsular exopolysaccharide synthesis family protein
MVILFGIIAAATTAVVSFELPKTYEAHARALVNPKQVVLIGNNGTDVGGNPITTDQLVATYVELINSGPVDQQLIQDGIPRTPDDLVKELQAKAKPGTTLIDITVQDGDPQVAQRIAEDVIPAFNHSLDQLQSKVQASQPATRLDALVPWQVPSAPPTAPVSPQVGFNTLIALIAGLAIGAALAFVLEYLDNTVKNDTDVQLKLGLPLLGAVALQKKGKASKQHPEGMALVTVSDPKSPISEAYRAIRTNLLFSSLEAGLRTIVVTSSIPGEGKTSTACNLAVAMAQAGNQVVLVDADFRRPTLHRIFHQMENVGLGNLILGNLPENELVRSTKIPNLRLVCSGPTPPNPSELLGSARMNKITEDLKGVADIVVFDTPPLGAVTDAAVLAARADGVLIVVERGRTAVPAIERMRTRLEAVGATIVGVVLNKVKESDAGDYYYYRYYQASANGKAGGQRGGKKNSATVDAGQPVFGGPLPTETSAKPVTAALSETRPTPDPAPTAQVTATPAGTMVPRSTATAPEANLSVAGTPSEAAPPGATPVSPGGSALTETRLSAPTAAPTAAPAAATPGTGSGPTGSNPATGWARSEAPRTSPNGPVAPPPQLPERPTVAERQPSQSNPVPPAPPQRSFGDALRGWTNGGNENGEAKPVTPPPATGTPVEPPD